MTRISCFGLAFCCIGLGLSYVKKWILPPITFNVFNRHGVLSTYHLNFFLSLPYPGLDEPVSPTTSFYHVQQPFPCLFYFSFTGWHTIFCVCVSTYCLLFQHHTHCSTSLSFGCLIVVSVSSFLISPYVEEGWRLTLLYSFRLFTLALFLMVLSHI